MMSKKELAEVEDLKTKLALRLYPEIEPDIDVPGFDEGIRYGWLYNESSMRVEKSCSSSTLPLCAVLRRSRVPVLERLSYKSIGVLKEYEYTKNIVSS